MTKRVCSECFEIICDSSGDGSEELIEILDNTGWDDVWPIEPGDNVDGEISGFCPDPCSACGSRSGWLYAVNVLIEG